MAFAGMHLGNSSSALEASGSSELSAQVVLAPPLENFSLALLNPANNTSPWAKLDTTPAVSAMDLPAKWVELQSRISEDEAAIAACRLEQRACSPAVLQFLSIVDLGRTRQGRVRLGWINRAVNMAIKPVSDWVQYGIPDFWASPLQTLASGGGDCEDYAVLKYIVLQQLGLPTQDLRLLVVQDGKRDVTHAVVAVRDGLDWLVLDNRTMTILRATDLPYRPLFALDQYGSHSIATVAFQQ